MPELRDMFLEVPPRETAGSRTGDRFQYQWDWALAHVLQLHKGDDDYLVAFDYHDDVIDFDSCTNPSAIRFYQVKTKENGEWKLADLLRRKKGKSKEGDGEPALLHSHIGKMYSNKILFPDCAKMATFITNAPLNLPVAEEGDSKRIPASKLKPKDLSRIAEQMMQEHSLSESPQVGDLLIFEQSPLTIEDHATQLKGRLSDFLEERYHEQKFQIGAIYRALIGEITMRCRPGSHASFEQFVRARCISREEFGKLLTKIGAGPESADNIWSRAEAQLQVEDMKPFEIKAVYAAWRKHEVSRRDPTAVSVRQLSETVREALRQMKECIENESLSMRQILQAVIEDNGVRSASQGLFDNTYVRAVALMEFYES